jgi:hypothetical protein
MTPVRAVSGIPIPERAGQAGRYPKYPWDAMRVGDSFPCDAALMSARSMVTVRNRLGERRFKAGLHQGAVRIWRVK